MRITDLPLSSDILEKIEAIEPFNTLNPPQVIAIQSGLLKKKKIWLFQFLLHRVRHF